MDSAVAVLERLERIRALELKGASAELLLGELRGLLHEAETYAAEEGGAGCDDAVDRLRRALARDIIDV